MPKPTLKVFFWGFCFKATCSSKEKRRDSLHRGVRALKKSITGGDSVLHQHTDGKDFINHLLVTVMNNSKLEQQAVISTSQNAVQVIAQTDNPSTCVKKSKAPPLPIIRHVQVLPDSHWRKPYLDVCRGDHAAAEILGKIAFRCQPKSEGTPRLENIRNTGEGQRAYWWGHKVEALASECGLKYEQTRYALRKLTAWGLIETRSAKTPVKMLQIRLLIAEGAASLNGWPDFGLSQIAICEDSQKAICGNSQMKSFKGVGSNVEEVSTDSVAASLATKPSPVFSSVPTGKDKPIPDSLLKNGKRPLTLARVWESTQKAFHRTHAVPLTRAECKVLRDARNRLYAAGVSPDVLVGFVIEHWFDMLFSVHGGSGLKFTPQTLSTHLSTALAFFHEKYISPEQAAAEQAKKTASLAEYAALAEASKAEKAAAPVKLNKFAQQLQAEQQATTPPVDACPCTAPPRPLNRL
jgi:hypothetical protein